MVTMAPAPSPEALSAPLAPRCSMRIVSLVASSRTFWEAVGREDHQGSILQSTISAENISDKPSAFCFGHNFHRKTTMSIKDNILGF
jgi:hypothetical protein